MCSFNLPKTTELLCISLLQLSSSFPYTMQRGMSLLSTHLFPKMSASPLTNQGRENHFFKWVAVMFGCIGQIRKHTFDIHYNPSISLIYVCSGIIFTTSNKGFFYVIGVICPPAVEAPDRIKAATLRDLKMISTLTIITVYSHFY